MDERKKLYKKINLKLYLILFVINSFLAYLVQVFVFLKRKLLNKPNEFSFDYDLTGWLCIVTGGSGEIGLACVRKLLRRNCKVIIATIPNPNQNFDELRQQLEQDLKEFKKELWELHYLNLSSFDSVNNFVETFKKSNRNIDILINNAAVFLVPFGITDNGFERHLAINFLGHCLLTLNLIPYLKPSASSLKTRKAMNLSLKSKVISISSYSHRWVSPSIANLLPELLNKTKKEDREFYSFYLAYSYSKLLVIAFNFYLSNIILPKLNNQDLSIVNVHPGAIASNLIINSHMNKFFLIFYQKEKIIKKFLWVSLKL